jgi:hypothetical protein
LVIINLSSKKQKAVLQGGNAAGSYTQIYSGAKKDVKEGDTFELAAWDYLVFSNK